MSSKTTHKAVTLVEVLVAVAVCAIGLLALVSVQVLALKTGTAGRETHTASVLADSVMSDVEAALVEDFEVSVGREEQPCPGHPEFTSSVEESVNPDGDLKKVVVVVSWDTERGRQAYRLETAFVSKEWVP